MSGLRQLQRDAREATVMRLDYDALADAASRAPDLFAGIDTVPIVRSTKEYLHTGKAITADQRLAEQVAVMRAAGLTLREIARRTGRGTNTIMAALTELEKSGVLETAKEVVERRLAHLVEGAMEDVASLQDKEYLTDTEVGRLKAGWVGVGVGLTHMGAARPAVVRHEHLHAVVPVEPARAYLASLAAASATQADDCKRKPLTVNASSDCDTVADAAEIAPGALSGAPRDGQPTGPNLEGQPAREEGGGGGLAKRAGGAGDDGTLSENFGDPKADHQP